MLSSIMSETTFAPISLLKMMSRRNQAAIQQGIIGQQSLYENGKYAGSRDRSAYEAFESVISDAFGCEAFCEERRISFGEDPTVLIDRAQMQLDIPDATKARILENLKPAEIIPHLMYADAPDAAVWMRVRDLSQDLFDANCPGTLKAMVSRKDEKQLKRQERPATPKERFYEPALDNARTRSAFAFRETLSALLLREWHSAIAVTEPFALDRLAALSDFIEKFQRSGYVMSDGGLSQGMVDRLDEIQGKLPGQVETIHVKLLTRFTNDEALPFGLMAEGTLKFLEVMFGAKVLSRRLELNIRSTILKALSVLKVSSV